jgi:uncharacterized protein Yka (UPF0111/DUF47 family)
LAVQRRRRFIREHCTGIEDRLGRILNLKGFSRFLVIGEKKVFGEIAEIVKTANEASQILKRMLKEPNLETLVPENAKMAEVEKRADELAFRVRRDITDGAVNPTVLDNLLECVEVADGMVDKYHYLARELTRIARVKLDQSLNRIATVDAAFLSMLELADESTAKLLELLAEGEMNEIRRERREIEQLEEKGDEIKDDSFDELYRQAPGMHYLYFAHYSDVLYTMDDILDACEDLADLAVAIITSISK